MEAMGAGAVLKKFIYLQFVRNIGFFLCSKSVKNADVAQLARAADL